METVSKLSEALSPKIEAAKAALITAVSSDADAKTIKALQIELETLRGVQTKMAKGEAQHADDAEQVQAVETIKAHIRSDILANDDYYYVHKAEKFLLYRECDDSWTTISERALKHHYPRLVVGSDYWNLFMEVLREDGRWFYGRTSSFHPAPGMLNMLRPQLLEPVTGPVHPVFELVIRSICGDKAENIEHLERVILAKRLKPDNYLLPVICLSDGGATGKSLFVSKVLPVMFGKRAVSTNTNMADFSGAFNGHLAGKLVILINENCEDSYNHNRMKAIAGSPSLTFTNKNEMPYEGDNTALLFVTGNSVAGSIRVDGGDVDRRFSIIRATHKLSHYVAPWLASQGNAPVSPAQAEAWMRTTGQDILSDPEEVGRWLAYLVTKHGAVTDVPALHGQDYDEAVQLQKSLMTQVFEFVFLDHGFHYVRRSLVYDFYQHEASAQRNRNSLGKKKFYRMLRDWLAENCPHVIELEANLDYSTAFVFADKAIVGVKAKPTLKANDSDYYHNDNGRRVWQVAL